MALTSSPSPLPVPTTAAFPPNPAPLHPAQHCQHPAAHSHDLPLAASAHVSAFNSGSSFPPTTSHDHPGSLSPATTLTLSPQLLTPQELLLWSVSAPHNPDTARTLSSPHWLPFKSPPHFLSCDKMSPLSSASHRDSLSPGASVFSPHPDSLVLHFSLSLGQRSLRVPLVHPLVNPALDSPHNLPPQHLH